MEENNIMAAMAMLIDNGITRVEIDFSGSGDSGDIDERRYYNGDDEIEPSNDVLEICESIEDKIFNSYYSYDWYNNEGGRGMLTIDIENQKWNIEGVTYYTEEQDACEDGDLTDVINSLKNK